MMRPMPLSDELCILFQILLLKLQQALQRTLTARQSVSWMGCLAPNALGNPQPATLCDVRIRTYIMRQNASPRLTCQSLLGNSFRATSSSFCIAQQHEGFSKHWVYWIKLTHSSLPCR